MRIFDSHYITGLAEWGGSFTYLRSNGGITICFVIKSSTRDLPLLLKIRDFFEVGKIYRGGQGLQKWAYYRVNRLGELIKIVSHFEKYPLQGFKQHAFAVWREMVLCKRRKLPKDKARLIELSEKLSKVNGGR